LIAVANNVPGLGNMMCKEHQDVNGIPYLVKLDPDGNVQWSFCFGGSYHTSISDAIVLDDGYLIYGFTTADDGGFQDSARVFPRDVVKHNDRKYTVASQMTYYEPGRETGDIDCPYNANMPNSGINFWVYHITDIFDYDNVGEVEDTNDAVGLKLHPNPASGIVTVKGDNIKMLEVVNLLRQTVLMEQCDSDNPTIDISILSPGVYLMKAKMADGSVFAEKIAKK